jgi:hypothetical protein
VGQVPNTANEFVYLIVGNGRLAKHLRNYFKLLNKKYFTWQRNTDIAFLSEVKHSDIILLAIKDNALPSFIDENYSNELKNKVWVHFSGSHVFDGIIGMHPLMTFTKELYAKEIYEQVPFIIDKEEFDFSHYFPGFKNPNYYIRPNEKAHYHAYCSMAGNLTTILWQRFFEVTKSKYGIDRNHALPYMQRIIANLVESDDPLTGPLKRKDTETIKMHLDSLEGDPFKEIYESFVNTYRKLENNKVRNG